MQIVDPTPLGRAPAENFTGDVWLERLAAPREEGQGMVVSRVRFAPGARTAWHTHPFGQTLHVLAGVAWVQSRGGEKTEAHAGQTLYCPSGGEHWHGATPDAFMEHLAMNDTDGDLSTLVTWGALVTEEEYLA